jgi:hypothetical protein
MLPKAMLLIAVEALPVKTADMELQLVDRIVGLGYLRTIIMMPNGLM